jgi:uncharacterized cupredoxin-like copper-binding protein
MQASTTSTSNTSPTGAPLYLVWALLLVLALGAGGWAIGRFLPVSTASSGNIAADVTLTSDAMRFEQTQITLSANESTTLLLANRDMFAHAFDIDALDIHIAMPRHSQVPVTFDALEPGTYTFYCGIPGHRDAGMVGTLVVTP